MNKKGAELSLNVIVIAVIVIVVLVVLIIIFSGRSNIFVKSTTQIEEPYSATRCDVPGTGRYCASECSQGDTDLKLSTFTCGDTTTRGTGKCCCCTTG